MLLEISLMRATRCAKEAAVSVRYQVATSAKEVANLRTQFAVRTPALENILLAEDHLGNLAVGRARCLTIERLQGTQVHDHLTIGALRGDRPRRPRCGEVSNDRR